MVAKSIKQAPANQSGAEGSDIAAATPAERAELLALIPQQKPFRFVDELHMVTADGAQGSYRFRKNEYFYAGHFPGNPVTPGVVLIETMAQIGLVPLAIYLSRLAGHSEKRVTLFTEADVEFSAMVRPDEEVTVKSQKLYYRRGKLKCDVGLYLANGELAVRGTLAGIGVPE